MDEFISQPLQQIGQIKDSVVSKKGTANNYNIGRDQHVHYYHAAAPKAEAMPKIQVLFLAANPKSTQRLAIDEEMRAIEQKVRAAGHQDVLINDPLPAGATEVK